MDPDRFRSSDRIHHRPQYSYHQSPGQQTRAVRSQNVRLSAHGDITQQVHTVAAAIHNGLRDRFDLRHIPCTIHSSAYQHAYRRIRLCLRRQGSADRFTDRVPLYSVQSPCCHAHYEEVEPRRGREG